MALRDFSIGGYSLMYADTWMGQDFQAYEVILGHRGKGLATISNDGGGGEDLIFFDRSVGVDLQQQVLKDMHTLIKTLERYNVVEPDGLWTDFVRSPEKAAAGFTHLLLDLWDFVKAAKSVEKTLAPHTHYGVAHYGTSWFSKNFTFANDRLITAQATYSSFDTAFNRMRGYFLKKQGEFGKIRALAIVEGSMDWHLTFEQYAQLYSP